MTRTCEKTEQMEAIAAYVHETDRDLGEEASGRGLSHERQSSEEVLQLADVWRQHREVEAGMEGGEGSAVSDSGSFREGDAESAGAHCRTGAQAERRES